MEIPPLVISIARTVATHGGRAMLVGGCVRDSVMGVVPKDFDLEIFGVGEGEIEGLLRDAGAHVLRCGRSFPVWKAWDDSMDRAFALDIALPRREAKAGDRRTEFSVVMDPSMTFGDASSRRDFTINAIGMDPLTREMIDPHGGIADLGAGRLRHVSAHFVEDPLRVLRGAQFCGRFNLVADPSTIALCQTLSTEHLSSERLWVEWQKIILKTVRPSLALSFLDACGWLSFFPELEALKGVQQDPDWHPEGDVWTHTLHCIDAFAVDRPSDEHEALVVGFAVLCHDMGKASTTEFFDGRWRAHGHEAAGDKPTRAFLARLTDENGFAEEVASLVVAHMVPNDLFKLFSAGQNTDRAIRRLAGKARIDLLARVCWCDKAGRPPLKPGRENLEWLVAEASRLNVSASKPVPLLLGRDLMDAGHSPGSHFGPVLKAVLEAQIDGVVSSKSEALALALEMLERSGQQAKS